MRKNFGTKSWFYPLPVLVIGTYDENGNPDAMNAAWGGLYDADKVVLCLSADHKTTKNIQAKERLPSVLLTLPMRFLRTMLAWCPQIMSRKRWRSLASIAPRANRWMRPSSMSCR